MQAECEAQVDRVELRKALSFLPRGKALDRANVMLAADELGLSVSTPGMTTIVKSAGRWQKAITVNAGMLKRLVGKLEDKELALLYFDGRLRVGRTSIPAREVAAAGGGSMK